MPTSTRSALLRLGRPEREATDIDAMCERLKIGDLGRRVLVQCCADGKVCADDASEILDTAFGALADPRRTRDAVREAPIPWPDFVGHLRLEETLA